MTEAEIVAYLLRWLLEFGPEPCSYDEHCMRNAWYRDASTCGIFTRILSPYISCPAGSDVAELTPAAFDLLRRYHESNH